MSATVDCTAVFDYESQPKEEVDGCNLCGDDQIAEFGGMFEPDRYGYSVRASMCADCGLIYLRPRMTAAAYASFYASGAYRRLVSMYHGREINEKTLQLEQLRYAARLMDTLQGEPRFLALTEPRVLDVGGSTGAVGHYFKGKCTVLDPAPAELAEAIDSECIRGTIEEFDPKDRQWDVVLLCQTIDHLLDPMLALRKIKGLLAPGGVFWVDALDYDKTHTIKIDHPFNFTESTMRAYLAKVGFEILLTRRDGDHVGLVCTAAA